MRQTKNLKHDSTVVTCCTAFGSYPVRSSRIYRALTSDRVGSYTCDVFFLTCFFDLFFRLVSYLVHFWVVKYWAKHRKSLLLLSTELPLILVCKTCCCLKRRVVYSPVFTGIIFRLAVSALVQRGSQGTGQNKSTTGNLAGDRKEEKTENVCFKEGQRTTGNVGVRGCIETPSDCTCLNRLSDQRLVSWVYLPTSKASRYIWCCLNNSDQGQYRA